MDKVLDFLGKFENQLHKAALLFVSISQSLCFIIALILLIIAWAADQRGMNLGFNAGRWAIGAGIVGWCIVIAKNIFGIA